jgi:hypothetical protein
MKGLVANPAGKTIELPIKSNLKEGFKFWNTSLRHTEEEKENPIQR